MGCQINSAQQAVTLRYAFEDYLASRELKKKTIEGYRQHVSTYLPDWLDLDLRQISKTMVQERHRSIPGKYMANAVMRTLKAICNYANYRYESADGDPYLKGNPVKRLSEAKLWNRQQRRRDVIRLEQLRDWFGAVYAYQSDVGRDIMLFLLFTGMRLGEARNLRWRSVDLKSGIVTLEDTKNHQDVEIPLNSFAWDLLRKRSASAKNAFVFPNTFSDERPCGATPRRWGLIAKRTGIRWSYHSLRRSFLSIGDGLDIKQEVLKQLVNHKLKDVTEGYIIRAPERLRRASQQICDAMLAHLSGQPNQKRAHWLPDTTLGQALEVFRSAANVPTYTRLSTSSAVNMYFKDWLALPILCINSNMIDTRVDSLRSRLAPKSVATVARSIRRLINFSKDETDEQRLDLTLQQVFFLYFLEGTHLQYQSIKTSEHMYRSVDDYKTVASMLATHYGEWLNFSLSKITPEMISEKKRTLRVPPNSTFRIVFIIHRLIRFYRRIRWSDQSVREMIKDSLREEADRCSCATCVSVLPILDIEIKTPVGSPIQLPYEDIDLVWKEDRPVWKEDRSGGVMQIFRKQLEPNWTTGNMTVYEIAKLLNAKEKTCHKWLQKWVKAGLLEVEPGDRATNDRKMYYRRRTS